MSNPHHQWLVLYREYDTTPWRQAAGVQGVQFNLESAGLTALIGCTAFGRLRSDSFIGALLLVELHEFSVELRFAPNTMLESRTHTENDPPVTVRASIGRAESFPELPLELKTYVRLESGFMHFTTKKDRANEFLGLISDSLRLENDQMRGAETVTAPAEPVMTQPLGRGGARPAPPPPPPPAKLPEPRGWLERLRKR